MKILTGLLVVLILQTSTKAQNKAFTDNKCLIETSTGGILIFNNFNKLDLYFYIDLKNTSVTTTDRNNLFSVGEYALQVLALDKTKFTGETDQEILGSHARSETAYMNNQFKAKLELKAEAVKLKFGSAYFWQYDLPESVAKDVQQLFVTLVYKDFIISLNTAKLPNQNFEGAKAFLMNAANSIVFTDRRINLEYLCRERKN